MRSILRTIAAHNVPAASDTRRPITSPIPAIALKGLDLGEVKAFAVPRAEWPAAFEQFGIPKGQTGPAEAMFEAVNAGWMDLGVAGTEHVAGTTLPRDVFAAAQTV